MKYVLLFFSTVFFFFGLLGSQVFKAYFQHEETYQKDTLKISSYVAGQLGAIATCHMYGVLASTGGKASLNCKLVNDNFPDIHIEKWGRNVEQGPYQEIPVLVGKHGKVYVESKFTGEIQPRRKVLPIFSLPTFFMLQLPIVLYVMIWHSRKQNKLQKQ